jgi:hypothetical protein
MLSLPKKLELELKNTRSDGWQGKIIKVFPIIDRYKHTTASMQCPLHCS